MPSGFGFTGQRGVWGHSDRPCPCLGKTSPSVPVFWKRFRILAPFGANLGVPLEEVEVFWMPFAPFFWEANLNLLDTIWAFLD